MPLNGVVCKELNCERITCEDFRNVVVSVSRGALLPLWPCSQRGLWPVSEDSVLGTSGSLFYLPLQSFPRRFPTQFTLWCPFRFSSVLCCADYGGLGPTSGPPEIPAVGSGTSQRGARQPSERKTHRTIPLFWVRAAGLSPALCKATDEPSSVPLWTHTPSYLFPKRGSGVARWGLFVKPGMFCTNENLSHGWLTGWKRARRGPGDSSWMRVMWNQVGPCWHSLAGGCFWGHGTLGQKNLDG